MWLLHGELPLEAFMPRCSLSVHHAGAGTCSCALRAAAPQLLCTVLFDQLGWAERVVYLGVGERLHFDLPAHATDSSRQEESKETFRLLERNIADVGLGSRVCQRLLALGERVWDSRAQLLPADAGRLDVSPRDEVGAAERFQRGAPGRII